MVLELVLTGLAGAVVGGVLAGKQLHKPVAGVVLGAAVGVAGGYFVFHEPPAVLAVDTPKDFDAEVIDAAGVVLVDFYADWCPPCRQLSPRIEELAEQYRDRVKVVKVDVDKGRTLAARYGIRGIPLVMFFKDGQPVGQLCGCHPKQSYCEVLDLLLAQ